MVQVSNSENKPTKVLSHKPYGSIAHLSMSKLGEGDYHIELFQERMMLDPDSKPEKFRLMFFLQEKLDGSNCSVVNWNGELVALTRSGYRCTDSKMEMHQMFARYVKEKEEEFKKLLPVHENRCTGEWLALAHGIHYKKDDLDDPYVIFDWFEKEHSKINALQLMEKMKDIKLKLIDSYIYFTPKTFAELEEYMHNIMSCNLRDERWEGFVLRTEKLPPRIHKLIVSEGLNAYLEDVKKLAEPWMIVKYVKQSHPTGSYLKQEIPVYNEIAQELLFKKEDNNA